MAIKEKPLQTIWKLSYGNIRDFVLKNASPAQLDSDQNNHQRNSIKYEHAFVLVGVTDHFLGSSSCQCDEHDCNDHGCIVLY